MVGRCYVSDEDRVALEKLRFVVGDTIKITNDKGRYKVTAVGMKLLHVMDVTNERNTKSVYKQFCMKDV